MHLTASDGNHFAAFLAEPADEPSAQIVILPDVRGLHHFYEELALRFADVGVRAVAIDYFGRTAPDDDRTEPFEFMPHVLQMSPPTFQADLQAGIDRLRDAQHTGLPTFTVGFCMGGSLSFSAALHGQHLAGVIGFYAGLTRQRGAVSPVVDFAGRIESPVLGLFGGADEGIPQTDIDTFKTELQSAGIEHEVVVYPGAPHSFFDRRATDYAQASVDAWSRIQGFIASHSASRF